MEKAFAYVCASEDTSSRILKRYCRAVFDLGYVPVCPRLGDGQYLDLEMSDEKKAYHEIARQKLGRCRMVVVCGREVTSTMLAEIGIAEKRKLICTTLDGLASIRNAENESVLH